MNSIKWFHLAVLSLALTVVSCNDKDSPTPDSEQDAEVEIAQEAIEAQRMFSDIYTISMQAFSDSETRSDELCGDLMLDTLLNTITVDYGTGCTGLFGAERAGKMIISYQGIPLTVGSEWTVNLESYRINDLFISGNASISNITLENDVYSFNYRVTEGTLTGSNGDSYTYSADHTYKWIKGINTLFNIIDDEWEVSGSGSGTTIDGIAYTSKTTIPIVGKTGCLFGGNAYLSTGNLQISVPSLIFPIDVNFGEGECDKEATVSWAGVTIPINLR